jgi:hypothetical protein
LATVSLIPIERIVLLDRSVILTERGIYGGGGDDFRCGHCGSLILCRFDPHSIRGNPIYRCGYCDNDNDLPPAD